MAKPDCNHIVNSLRLVREGASQPERDVAALHPEYAPVNEHAPEHAMVFAQAFARFLCYFNDHNTAVGNWQAFFQNDVSARLALAAVQDVAWYQSRAKEYFDFLNDRNNRNDEAGLILRLGYLFACAGSLARQLDALKTSLPAELPFRAMLQNLIRSRLAGGFERLLSYYKADLILPDPVRLIGADAPDMQLLGSPVANFAAVYADGLSRDWFDGSHADWNAYVSSITPVDSVFGTGTVFEQTNHIATHNLFTAVFDDQIKVLSRVVIEARKSLEATFTGWDNHEPHYALFLAFLRLYEYIRAETNTLTQRHLDFYYKDILGLREKSAEPGHAHLLVELAKHAYAHQLPAGTLFKAGKDGAGREAFYQNDRDFTANQATVVALQTVYRHHDEFGTGSTGNINRLYASPVSNSDDGLGAELLREDKSWHPLFNKVYKNNKLEEIRMPKAELGFALASPQLYLTEGRRKVDITLERFAKNNLREAAVLPKKPDVTIAVTIALTTEKGWYLLDSTLTIETKQSPAAISFTLPADAPAVMPYHDKIHGGQFHTSHPVIKITLKHEDDKPYGYAALENFVVQNVSIQVQVGLNAGGTMPEVDGIKNLAVSNDFGPVDVSKPFQPFGPAPQTGDSLIIGHKEIFQKPKPTLYVRTEWNEPSRNTQSATIYYLSPEGWKPLTYSASLKNLSTLALHPNAPSPVDYSPNAWYRAENVSGFIKISSNGGYKHSTFQQDLINHLTDKTNYPNYPETPYTPEIQSISLSYSSKRDLVLNSATTIDPDGARFYHLSAFGIAEQHPSRSGGNSVYLLPQFRHTDAQGQVKRHEAEFYIGIAGLRPPQNLALLFQVADGTADPLSAKPSPHLHWSYLRNNEWIAFQKNEVDDQSGELTRSGIVTLAMPRDAAAGNTLLTGGLHWIRIGVSEKSESVCRLIAVAAQALHATFSDHDNDPAFGAAVLPGGTIAKLDEPNAAVKKIQQSFATFGGRGQEAAEDFYIRISERLRHKDRGIAIWDYERLVLEAFPQLYKVKCLNHTEYEPTENSKGIYRELAAGHVTVVCIPNLQFQNLRDPLRPYTSLGVLLEVEQFLRKRLSCFVRLHVKNPQFEPVRTQFRVRLYPGFDETYHVNLLRQEITRFLSPWAFPGGGNPSFGGKIYKSTLINFIEERSYVDYVTDFKLFHHIDDFDGKSLRGIDRNEVEASTAVSILVSVPADATPVKETHEIEIIKETETPISNEKCQCQSPITNH